MGEIISTKAHVDGVRLFPLKKIDDERGAVIHMMRSDSPWFEKFGEIYFSLVKKGAIKAWKKHQKMTQNLSVPSGEIKLVLFDDRSGSPTKNHLQKIQTGLHRYGLIQIPPDVWYGFQGVGCHETSDSLIANCTTLPHDPQEVDRLPWDTDIIPYRWVP